MFTRDQSRNYFKLNFKNHFEHDLKSSFWARSRNFFQSIEKMFWDRARKRTFVIMPKVIFKKKKKNYFGYDPGSSIRARSRTILIEKNFGIVPEKELSGSCPKPFLKFKKILSAWCQKFFSGMIPKHFD